MSIGTERVYQAELTRVRGPRKAQTELVAQMRSEAGISMNNWPHSPEEQFNLMRSWRIWVDTLMQIYKGEWDGNQAVKFLWEARDVCKRYYDNPKVMSAAIEMRTDPKDHEYQMRVEMLRDEGRLALYLAELTGNPELIKQAKRCFNSALETAEKGTFAWGLTLMETEIVQKRLGRKISWGNLYTAYLVNIGLSADAGNCDQMATISWMYAKQALLAGKKENFKLGLTSLQFASENLGINWVKYPLREVLSIPLALSRRLTHGH